MYTYIQIAHIVLECETALAIGSGNANAESDNLVRLDHNGLPIIPWTAVKGALKSLLSKNEDDKKLTDYLGKIEIDDKKNKSYTGSQLIGSDALILNSDYKVQATLAEKDPFKDKLLKYYKHLPTREHTAINAYGSALDHQKYSNSIVYKGTRFKLELKLELEKDNSKDVGLEDFIKYFSHPLFRLGAQTTNGLGKMKPITCQTTVFNLATKDGINNYMDYSPDLNTSIANINSVCIPHPWSLKNLKDYSFNFESDALHIGAGYGDEETDHANLKEYVITWNNNNPTATKCFVIPGSSVKGVLNHRTFFHWCTPFDSSSCKETIDNYYTNEHNKWKKTSPFGFENQQENGETIGNMGQVIIEDVYIPQLENETLFNHNKLDRYTQGTINGALFSEKVFWVENSKLNILYLLKDNENKGNKKAFIKALHQLKESELAIGGATTIGNGFIKEITNEN